MDEAVQSRLRVIPDAKKLAIAIYGESVAAYRYAVLADKAANPAHRELFTRMKEEEEGHRRALETLAKQHFPEGDFLLSQADKDLVIVGARMLEAGDAPAFLRAMQFLHDTERRTGQFYQTLAGLMPDGELGAFLREMSAECFQHAESLLSVAPP